MRERPSVIIVAASLVLAWPAAAAEKPAAPPVQQASQPADQRAPTVLASADAVKMPPQLTADASQTIPKRPRAARVTTCRCGDTDQR